MTSTVRTEAPGVVIGGTERVGIAAAVAMAGFRLGLAPGGLVGVDLALALLGWWLASPAHDHASRRERLARAWQLAWGPLMAAIALAVVWALLAPSVRLDDVVRGEALAAFGGYANWHQLLVGPMETYATRLRSPLQHLWASSVIAQSTLVWWAVVAWSRRRSSRRPGAVDRTALVLLALGASSFIGGLALLVAGAGGQTLLLASVPRATAFFLGAALGASAASDGGDLARSVATGTRWVAVAGLLVCAAFAGPASGFGRVAGTTIVPIFAVLVVGGWSARPSGPAGVSRADHGAVGLWPLLVCSWFVLTPSLAVARVAVADAPIVVVDVLGLVLAAAVSVPLALVCGGLSREPAARERRKVLAPPAAVLLMVILGSVTGAFHWESPQPREDWPRAVVEVGPLGPWPTRPAP